MSEVATGGCLCGDVRYVVTAPLGDVVYCHCSICRRWSGAASGAGTPVVRERMKLDEERGLLWYVDRNDRSRGFCGTCGSGVFWSREGDPEIYIYAGSLDEPTGLRTEGHMMVDSRADWEDLTGVAPMYAEDWGERLVDPAEIVRG